MPPFYNESSSLNNSPSDYGHSGRCLGSCSSSYKFNEATTILFPTFVPSCTRYRLRRTSSCSNTTTKKKKKRDAFQYYSNDQVRIKHLMMSSEDGGSGSITTTEEEQPTQPHQERKSRISFELHPSVIFDKLLEDEGLSGDDDNDSVDIINFLEILLDVQIDDDDEEDSAGEDISI